MKIYNLLAVALACAGLMASPVLADQYPATAQNTNNQTNAVTPVAIVSGGGGGGGGAVTIADGADVTQGAKADAVCASDTATCTEIALLKREAQNLTSVVSALTGVSTAANQTTGNSSLSTIATNTTGAATAAKQDTGNTSLASIVTNTTGIATAANQATMISQFPASLGAKTGAASLSVVPNSDTNFQVVGAVANNAVTAGNPVLVGCSYQTTGALAALTAGNTGNTQCDARGNLRVSVVSGASPAAPVDTATTVALDSSSTTNAASSATVHGGLSYSWNGAALEYTRSGVAAISAKTGVGAPSDVPLGQFNTTPATLTTGQYGALQLTANQSLLTAKQDNGTVTVTSATGTTTLFTADTTNYDYVAIQLTGTFTAGVTFTASDDNTTYNQLICIPAGGSAGASGTSSASLWTCSGHRYIRAAVTSYTSGTVGATAYLKTGTVSPLNTVSLGTSTASIGVVTPVGATSTVAASTIATANTYQSALASSTTRKGCLIVNKSTNVEYVFIGAPGSGTTATSFILAAGSATADGGTFSCGMAQGVVITDQISITSATISSAYLVVNQ